MMLDRSFASSIRQPCPNRRRTPSNRSTARGVGGRDVDLERRPQRRQPLPEHGVVRRAVRLAAG